MSVLPQKQARLLLGLARLASGKVGADIERVVREARGSARRDRRPLVYADLEARLLAGETRLTGPLRRRFAVHEAGHAVICTLLKLGTVTRVSIDEAHGGLTTVSHDPNLDGDEAHFSDQLVYLMAGRAAEQVLIGTISAGAGSMPGSDLDRATALAAMMEGAMGFGAEQPLLYHEREARHLRLIHDRDFSERVHGRIERAERKACRLVKGSREEVAYLAAVLEQAGTIEAKEVASVLMGRRTTSSR